MKKIELHIHTVQTISDSQFKFSLDTFKKYADEVNLEEFDVKTNLVRLKKAIVNRETEAWQLL